MNAIKDQAASKNKQLLLNIVLHAIEQVNFAIRNLNKRSTIGMLMQCEDTLTDLLPIVKMIADDDVNFESVYSQMSIALSAAQIGGEPMEIEL
ncbi:hypothetical protein I6E78_18115 [Pseudoalteromonas sp. NZS127]|uniref:hypothetical protein n=1 Tax=Pseudoalteromonas sp. NZS127 TaxID=2792047 RepID=UPI0018CF1FAF|nr:hypothetical protein [Pseudoalteromonas sp. NZS127]MBH0073864.1 hypothetical protein [Pseudoalteromonas sp. NZS127]